MPNFDNNIYNKNIEALKESCPEIELEDLASSDRVVVEDCKNGQKTLKVNVSGKYKYVHSKYDPVAEAQKWAESIDIKRNSKIVVYGLGFAYHIEELAKRLGSANVVYIVEPNYDIFSELIKNRDISALLSDERIKFLLGDTDEIAKFLFFGCTISWYDFDNVIYTCWPICTQIDTDKYLTFMQIYRNGFSKLGVDRNTFIYFVPKWHEMGFANLKYTVDSINYMGFQNAFDGVPCVLVSAGPSLNKNVHLLKEIKGKFPILCVYTALKVLKRNGIEPDFIISLDSGQTHLENEQTRIESIDTPLFCEAISDKSLLQRHTGHKMFMSGAFAPLIGQLFSDFDKPSRAILIGGSVACSALDLLVFMGANPVILIGQDLAFTGGKTHAEGTFYGGNTGLKEERKYTVTEDIYGEDVPIDEVFLSFKLWFDYYIMERSDKIDFIDATEGGAKILGTKIMTFREAIDQNIHKSVDVEKIIKKIFSDNPLFIGEEKTLFLDKLNKMADSFDALGKALTKGIGLCKKMIKIYEKNEQKIKTGTIEKCLKELDSIDKKLNKDIVSFNAISILFQSVQYRLLNFDDNNELSEELYILNKNLLLYNGLKVLIEHAKPDFLTSIKEFSEEIGKGRK